MKLKIENTQLAQSVKRLQGALVEKSLTHIGLRAKNQKLFMTALDRVIAIYVEEDCSISEEGELLFQQKFFRILLEAS